MIFQLFDLVALFSFLVFWAFIIFSEGPKTKKTKYHKNQTHQIAGKILNCQEAPRKKEKGNVKLITNKKVKKQLHHFFQQPYMGIPAVRAGREDSSVMVIVTIVADILGGLRDAMDAQLSDKGIVDEGAVVELASEIFFLVFLFLLFLFFLLSFFESHFKKEKRSNSWKIFNGGPIFFYFFFFFFWRPFFFFWCSRLELPRISTKNRVFA